MVMKRSLSAITIISCALLSATTSALAQDITSPEPSPSASSAEVAAPVVDVYATAVGRLHTYFSLPAFIPVAAKRTQDPISNSESQPFCSTVFRVSTNGGYYHVAAGSIGARQGAHSCSAEQAAAITAPVASGQCALITAIPAEQGRDLDLVGMIVGGADFSDELSADQTTILLCNENSEAADVILRGRLFDSSANAQPAPALISRVDLPVSAIVNLTAQDIDAAFTQPVSEEQFNTAAQSLVQLLGEHSHPKLNRYTFSGVQARSIAICSADMGEVITSRSAPIPSLVINPRTAANNGCTAEQAAAISAPVAPNTCAAIGMYGTLPGVDIDLFVFEANERVGADAALDEFPVVIVCNNTNEAKNITLRAARLESPARIAPIARVNFAAGANGTGMLSDEVLRQRRAAAQQEAIAAAVVRFREIVANNELVRSLEEISPNMATQPVCGVVFHSTFAVPLPTLSIASRTGENACSAAQARAINANIARNQCALFIAHGVYADGRIDTDLQLKINGRALGTAENELIDQAGVMNGRVLNRDYDNTPYVYICNEGRSPLRVELLGSLANASSGQIPGLVTRINFRLATE